MKLPKFVQNLAFLVCIAAVPATFATPLALNYTVTQVGSLYHYDFKLTLDNHDGSFAVGNGFGWLIFDDVKGTGDPMNPPLINTPIGDFVLDAGQYPVGPCTSLPYSQGEHNGPTFDIVTDLWTPTSVGDFLTWSGVSVHDVGDVPLLFSTIVTAGNAVGADFEIATRNGSSVPESGATVTMCGLMFIGLVALRRRRMA